MDDRWEYQMLTVDISEGRKNLIDGVEVIHRGEVDRVANALGREGWELHLLTVAGSFAYLVFRARLT